MLAQIWFIHGAGSSPLTFNWLKGQLLPHQATDVSYENRTPLRDTIVYLRSEVAKCEEPPVLIGHSLGGVIAAGIAQEVPVKKIVTIGSPFGGSIAASMMGWFMPSQLMRDINVHSPVLLSIQRQPPKVPILSFVTDSGVIMMGDTSDGVVSVKSQTALKGPIYRTVNYNHFEVLMTPEVAHGINDFVFESLEAA